MNILLLLIKYSFLSCTIGGRLRKSKGKVEELNPQERFRELLFGMEEWVSTFQRKGKLSFTKTSGVSSWGLFSLQKNLQNFSGSPSHRIFGHMHEALNIDKK
jgi:hypothetical protein